MPTERSKKYPGDLNIISLGAGVQSSMMALAFSRGEFQVKPGGSGKIDFAIFADTQNEGDGTYAWLDYLEKQLNITRCLKNKKTKKIIKKIYQKKMH